VRPRTPRQPALASHDRWLISYADFITLLFAFFVVLFASSQADRSKQARAASSIHAAFDQMGLFDASAKRGLLTDGAGVNVAGGLSVPDAAKDAARNAPPPNPPMELLRRQIEAVASPEIRAGAIGLSDSANGLTISLREAKFFDSGAAELRPPALPVLDRIAAALPETGLRVEGHTDDVPIHTPQYASNWELSSARASSVARLLLKHANVHGDKLSVSGYAEFHPVAGNATEEGRARNRRVDIVVLAGK
jgi:chemotaxis protein MotB